MLAKCSLIVLAALAAGAVQVPEAIHEAAARGDSATVRSLLDGDPTLVEARDRYGWTPLHRAALGVHAAVLELLIERGADVDAGDNAGMTALHHAVRAGNRDAAECLLRGRADPEAADDEGNTALTFALTGRHEGLVDLLLESGVEVPTGGESGRRTLHVAAASGNRGFVRLMLERGADLSSRSDSDGRLLHSAAAGGDSELARELIAAGLDVGERDRYGMMPLHVAALEGRLDVTRLLVESGADLEAATAAGQTPVWFARLGGHAEVAAYLQSAGAEEALQESGLAGDYFGLEAPGSEPVLFGRGIVSSYLNDHGGLTVSPDGRAIYWAVAVESRLAVLSMERANGHWTVPQSPSFADPRFDDYSAVTAPDGRRLFFTSRRPLSEGADPLPWLGGLRVWSVAREGEGWSAPQPLDTAVAAGDAFALSVAGDGTLYFSALRSEGGSMDIYWARYESSGYLSAERLGAAVNSEHAEDTPFIAPDQSYLIFTSFRSGGLGGADLYVSFRERDGSWTPARNLGASINSSAYDGHPFVTRDGKYLFFASSRNGNRDYYWLSASVIQR